MSNINFCEGQIHRGAGIVARWPGIALVIAKRQKNDHEAIAELFTTLGNNPEPQQLADIIEPHLDSIISLGYVAHTFNGLEAYVTGPIQIVVDGKIAVIGPDESVTQTTIDYPSQQLTIVSVQAPNSEPVIPYDLRHGVAPGGALTLTNFADVQQFPDLVDTAIAKKHHAKVVEEEMQSSIDTVAPQIQQSEDETQYKSVLMPTVNPLDLRPLPIADQGSNELDIGRVEVTGILCPRSHFNNPKASFCMICGVSMAHLTHDPVLGPRPTLGFIIFDDGATFGLSRSYAIGRNPDKPDDPSVEVLRLYEDNETISRDHAWISLDDWSVKIVDKGSTNGTFIWDEPNQTWDQLNVDEPVEIVSGTTIALGRRAFVYESVEQQASD